MNNHNNGKEYNIIIKANLYGTWDMLLFSFLYCSIEKEVKLNADADQKIYGLFINVIINNWKHAETLFSWLSN